jgi:ATP-dependent Clp protease adaptor protein ClpS
VEGSRRRLVAILGGSADTRLNTSEPVLLQNSLPLLSQTPEAPGRTATVPREETEERTRSRALEPYAVVLYNDDVNSMDHVVRSLVRSVPGMGTAKAVRVMLEAHNNGQAVVIRCPLELAELVRGRLESCGLTATIEAG